MVTLAQRVKRARQQAGLTQLQLALAASCDPISVSRIERGLTVRPSESMLSALASALNLQVSELMPDDDQGKKPERSGSLA